METTSAYSDLVTYIVKSLVDYPDQVTVREIEGKTAITIEISVADSDMGRVIGKGGSVVNSIRTILRVLEAKQDKSVSLEIV